MHDTFRATPYGTAAEWVARPGGEAGPASPPVERSTTWARQTAAELRSLGLREGHDEFYSRYGHPNVRAMEAEVAANEGGEGAVSFASGMAAVHAVLSTLARNGERVAVAHQVYGGVSAICRHELPNAGVEVDRFDVFDEDALARVLERSPRLCWVESPVNPTMRIVDLERVAARCHEAGVLLVCDGTFAPAPVQRAITLGVDLVVHSLTKYYGGHSDVLGGIVVGNHGHCAAIEAFRARTGAILGPDGAWLVQRSLRTHRLRVLEQNRAAAELARELRSLVTPGGPLRAVHHPSLPDHRDHDLARRQMPGGFGAVLTLSVTGGYDAAVAAVGRLRTILPAPSLGGVESLVSLPVDSSHTGLDEEGRRIHGIDDGMLRISIGLEPTSELLADLRQALGVPGE